MFFMFYVIFIINICFLNTRNLVLGDTENSNWIYKVDETIVTTEKQNGSIIKNFENKKGLQQTYLDIIEKRNKSSNLQSNVFDEMLSNEMLSIQQYLYKKEPQTSSIHITTGNNAPTPTLEVKQRWSVINLLSNTLSEQVHVTFHAKFNEISTKKAAHDMHSLPCKDKVVGLRSLSDITPKLERSISLQNMKLCTCMKTDPHTTCTHRCRGFSKQLQNLQTLKNNRDNFCSRTKKRTPVPDSDSPFYASYQSYLTDGFTKVPFTFYYPLVINELTTKKSNKFKKKKPYKDDLYYDKDFNTDTVKEDYFYDDYLESDDYRVNINKLSSKDRPFKDQNVVINLEYEENERLKDVENLDDILDKGLIQIPNKNEFADQIINDLKKHYSDYLVKDCYCSSSIINVVSSVQCFICYICVILYFKICI